MNGSAHGALTLGSGVKLSYCNFPGGSKTPALCLHGLTRNLKDFEDFAPWLAATGRDVAALSLRGRGDSDYDPDYLNYHPLKYRDDVLEALDLLGWTRAIFIGTSLGGIVTMAVCAAAPARVAAVVLNDIGPELAPEGVARIAGYAGGARPDAQSLAEAAAQIRAINEVAFPGRDDAFWRMFAARTFRREQTGRWRPDYDPNIGRALLELGPAPDLWPLFDALAGRPTLSIRGAISDLLTPPIVDKMKARHAALKTCTVANTGHAPTLTEPEALAAIREFLDGSGL